jgi:hypothetical protein
VATYITIPAYYDPARPPKKEQNFKNSLGRYIYRDMGFDSALLRPRSPRLRMSPAPRGRGGTPVKLVQRLGRDWTE